MRRLAFLGLVLCPLGAVSLACSEEVLIGLDRPDAGDLVGGSGGSASGSGGTGDAGSVIAAGTSGSGGALACEQAHCGNSVYACGDCEDNDLDGLIDADDPECLGPCDATEGSLMLGIQGNDPGSCLADCAFDRGASRNDGCTYSHRCDPLAVAPSYPPTGRTMCEYDEDATLPGSSVSCSETRMTQPAGCLELCLPLAPNGCDCFGCCELPGRSDRFIWVGRDGADVDGCTAATLDDPSACPPCTPVPSCFNPCDECEYCTGGVTPAPTCPDVATCDGGRTACTGRAGCPSGHYCITGCCVPEPT
jgi:hypothetical protein